MFINEAFKEPTAEMYLRFTTIFNEILDDQYAVEVSTEGDGSYEIQSGYGVMFFPAREGHGRLVDMILKTIEQMRDTKRNKICTYSPCVQNEKTLYNSNTPDYAIFGNILRFFARSFENDNIRLMAYITEQVKDVVMQTILKSEGDFTFTATVKLFADITERNIIEEIYAFNDKDRRRRIFMDVESCSRLQAIWDVLKHGGHFTSEELVDYVITDDFSAFEAFGDTKNKENYDFLYSRVLELLKEDQNMLKEKFERFNKKSTKRSLELHDGVEGLQETLWKKISQ